MSTQKDESVRIDYVEIQKRLAYTFEDRSHLERAVTRAAYAKEEKDRTREEHEDQNLYATLGDAVLKAALTELLVDYDFNTSDDVSKARADLEGEEMQAEVAKFLRIEPSIRLGGSEKDRGAGNKELADTLEALIGAIHLDGKNYEKTKEIVIGWYRKAGLLDELVK